MKFLVVFLVFLVSTVHAFGISSARMALGGVTGGSSFVVSQQQRRQTSYRDDNTRRGDLTMGSMAKFGIFSPAVYAAKVVLGQDKLNKIRGKAISLHSQSISDFCEWAGAYHLRTRLIQKAKKNGDTLGFLV